MGDQVTTLKPCEAEAKRKPKAQKHWMPRKYRKWNFEKLNFLFIVALHAYTCQK